MPLQRRQEDLRRQALPGRRQPERARVGDQRELPPVGRALRVEHVQLTYGSSAQYSASSRAANVFPPAGSAPTRSEFHISGTLTSWPRSSRPERRGLPDVGLPARQQRRTPDRHGERVTVSDPQRVTPLAGRVAAQEHLRLGDVQARTRSCPWPSIASFSPLPYGRSTRTRRAVAVAGHRRAEHDLLVRLVRVAEPGRVVGPQDDVGVEDPEPGRHHSRGDDPLVRRPPGRASSGSATAATSGPGPPAAELASSHDRDGDQAADLGGQDDRRGPSGSPAPACAASTTRGCHLSAAACDRRPAAPAVPPPAASAGRSGGTPRPRPQQRPAAGTGASGPRDRRRGGPAAGVTRHGRPTPATVRRCAGMTGSR